MSLETVVEDIRRTPREWADDILKAAEREGERQTERVRDQQRSNAILEAKQARCGQLETVREDVEASAADLGGETRESLTRALFEAAAEVTPKGSGPISTH